MAHWRRLTILGVLLAASPATAHKRDSGKGQQICVAFAGHWSATPAETAAIRRDPIAPSFRQIIPAPEGP